MAKPVIYYFPVKAMGESARLLLAYGGEDFVDHRVTFDDWPALKPCKLLNFSIIVSHF